MSAKPRAIAVVLWLMVAAACTSSGSGDGRSQSESESTGDAKAAAPTAPVATTEPVPTPSENVDAARIPRYQLAKPPNGYRGPIVDIALNDEQLILYVRPGYEHPPESARTDSERVSVLTVHRDVLYAHSSYALLGELVVRGDKQAIHIVASSDPADDRARSALVWHERPGVVVEVWARGDRSLLEVLAAEVVDADW